MTSRRSFLSLLGFGAVAGAVAPKMLSVEPVPDAGDAPVYMDAAFSAPMGTPELTWTQGVPFWAEAGVTDIGTFTRTDGSAYQMRVSWDAAVLMATYPQLKHRKP